MNALQGRGNPDVCQLVIGCLKAERISWNCIVVSKSYLTQPERIALHLGNAAVFTMHCKRVEHHHASCSPGNIYIHTVNQLHEEVKHVNNQRLDTLTSCFVVIAMTVSITAVAFYSHLLGGKGLGRERVQVTSKVSYRAHYPEACGSGKATAFGLTRRYGLSC